MQKKTPVNKVKKEEAGNANTKKTPNSEVKKEKPGNSDERDPLRIFYESLHKQMPASEMAAIWMMESGLLPKDLAKKLFEAKKNKAQQQKLGSPMKTAVTVKKQSDSSVSIKKQTDSSVSVKKKTTVSTETKKTPPSKAPSVRPKKRKIVDESSDEGSDGDFVISRKIKKPKAA